MTSNLLCVISGKVERKLVQAAFVNILYTIGNLIFEVTE